MQIEFANKMEETGSSAKIKLQIKKTGPEGRDIINLELSLGYIQRY